MNKLLHLEITGFLICAVIYNVLSTLLNWWMLYVGIQYMIANAVSYFAGVLLAYALNTRFVFKKQYSLMGCIKFCSVYFSNFIITMILTFVLVDILSINAYLAPLLTMVLSSGYNFIMSKYFVFKKEKSYEKSNDLGGQ